MQSDKVSQEFEIEREQLEWLGEIAKAYGLDDEDKALRVLLDFAIEDGNRDFIFSSDNTRCRFCG